MVGEKPPTLLIRSPKWPNYFMAHPKWEGPSSKSSKSWDDPPSELSAHLPRTLRVVFSWPMVCFHSALRRCGIFLFMGDIGKRNFYGKLSWRNHGKTTGTLGCNPLRWEGGTNHGNFQVVVTSYKYYLEFSYLVLGEDGSNLTRIFFEMGWNHPPSCFFSIEIE